MEVLGVILLLIGIGGCLLLPTHFKLPKVLREEESEQKAFRILLIVIIVGFVGAMACLGAFDGSSSSSPSSDISEEDMNDMGYYKKNGKWYFQGDGAY